MSDEKQQNYHSVVLIRLLKAEVKAISQTEEKTAEFLA